MHLKHLFFNHCMRLHSFGNVSAESVEANRLLADQASSTLIAGSC